VKSTTDKETTVSDFLETTMYDDANGRDPGEPSSDLAAVLALETPPRTHHGVEIPVTTTDLY